MEEIKKLLVFFKKNVLLHFFLISYSLIFFAFQYLLFNGVNENNFYIYIVLIYLLSFVIFFLENSTFKKINFLLLSGLYLLIVTNTSILFFNIFSLGNKFSLEKRLTYEDIQAFFQSDLGEIHEFISFYIGIYFYLILFFCLIAVWLLKKIITQNNNFFKHYNFLFFIIFSFFLSLYSLPINDFFSFTNTSYKSYKNYSDQIDNFISNEINLLPDDTYLIKNQTHILVIGESFNKDHSSAYGYFRETTPWMKKMRSNQNALFLENAYSSYCHTAPSLNLALTNFNQYKNNIQMTNLVSFLNSNLFDVHWFTEQVFYQYDIIFNSIASKSKDLIKLDENNFDKSREKILEVIKKNTNKNKLIVIHLAGSHASYFERIKYFNGTEFDSSIAVLGDYAKDHQFVNKILNPYDHTIENTDYKLSIIYDLWIKSDNPGTFTFFSDHGEDVYDQKYHTASNFSFPMIRIPFLTIFNDNFIKKSGRIYKELKDRSNDIFTLDLFYETYLDLLGFNRHYDDRFSFFGTKSIVGNLEHISMKNSSTIDINHFPTMNPVKINDDPDLIAKKNVQKLNQLFPGRVMSATNDYLVRAWKFQNLGFKNIEFNYTPHINQVGHYPEYTIGIDLEDYLNQPIIKNFDGYWVDIKMPNSIDDDALFEKVNLKLEPYNNKKFLIESQTTNLKIFKKYDKSFYILFPEDSAASFGFKSCQMETQKDNSYFFKNEKSCAIEIAMRVNKSGANQLSFYYHHYDFVKNSVLPLLDKKNYKLNIFGFPPELSIYNKDMINNLNNKKYDFLHDSVINLILFV